MNILIDIGHPAHVHLFKNFAKEMLSKGNHILFTVRDKEHELYLLNTLGFSYVSFGKHFKSKTGKVIGLIKFNVLMLIAVLRFKPDIFLSHGSIYAAQVAWITGKPHISMEDSGNMEQIKLYRPFTKVIISPDVLPEELGPKQIRIRSYHEIAYLHPKYFKPDKSVLKLLGVKESEPYCILRFVSWKATHDEGHKGFSNEEKIKLVNILKDRMKVFISSESTIISELSKYKITVPPDKMHDILYFATLFIGEGATMASESGILGTTAIYVNSIRRSYCEDQERFGLVYNFQNSEKAFHKINELFKDINSLKNNEQKRNTLLREKINPTAFLVWFIENYPESFRIMKEDPGFQEKFK